MPYHDCTAEEFDAFAPPSQDSVGLFEMYRTSSTRHLSCLDLEKFGDELAIWSTNQDEISYQRFDFVLLPCNYVHAEFGPTDDVIADECIADRDSQMDYLGNLIITILTTEEVFN